MEIATYSFLKRLQRLHDRLSPVLHRFEYFRITPTGHLVTPETDSYRPYTPGDDPKYIDWNIYARQDKYFVKTVVREDQGVVHLLVDSSGSMSSPYPVKYLRCLETAAAIGYLALMAGNQVVLHSWSDSLLMSRSYERKDSPVMEFLKQFETLPSGPGTDLGRTLEQLGSKVLGATSRILILSDFIDLMTYREPLGALQSLGARVAAIRIMHEREVSPRMRGNFRIYDPESGEQIKRLVGYRLQKEYRNRIKQHMTDTAGFFHQKKIPFLSSTARESFEDMVIRFFRLPVWYGGR